MAKTPLLSLLLLGGCVQSSTPPATMTEAYLALGDKLAADSTEGLDRMAAALVEHAERRRSDPGVDPMITSAKRVVGGDIASARAAFRTLSVGMIEFLAGHPREREHLVLVHCTMTFGGEGAYWVQRSGTVMNPYEGVRMRHCGELVPWENAPPSGG